ncbi:SRPBCC family protein [Reinekea marinisedimentorum]|uniref:Polyketide cyclase/dehydrase/lipid transport protein n=1 Tax=Reinekea marinisedimentorum TaxID=230495 RepID=A0A4R3ID08_9GAMM|nr:SRPBCC family protein [Reinekea marinisedimentorum]TCS43704.1 polyketide cyclase/dehydrase/lipid transport protein [Reinekea marinisedimentorum]
MSIPFTVERSITIKAPAKEVYCYIADFKNWPSWSPWLTQEPDCPVEITGTPEAIGHTQSWDGKKIGSGHIELTDLIKSQQLVYDLHFLKPWKSHSTAGFKFQETHGTTEVTWYMQGTLPSMMFLMKKKVSDMVGADYEKGLAMLKQTIESNS